MTDDMKGHIYGPDPGNVGYEGETGYASDPAYLSSLANDDISENNPFEEDLPGEAFGDESYAYGSDYDDREPDDLSYEDIRRIVREESDRVNRESWPQDEIIDRAVQRTAQAMEQRYALREAPMVRRELVEDLTVGLGSHAKQYLNDYFQGYTSDVFNAIRQDPKTMDMLRRAAEYENSRLAGSRPAPRTESTYGIGDTYDGNFERSIDAMWKGGFNSVPGLTKEKFRDEMKRRVS